MLLLRGPLSVEEWLRPDCLHDDYENTTQHPDDHRRQGLTEGRIYSDTSPHSAQTALDL